MLVDSENKLKIRKILAKPKEIKSLLIALINDNLLPSQCFDAW